MARGVTTTPQGLAALTDFYREAELNMCEASPYFDEGEDSTAFAISLNRAVKSMTGKLLLAESKTTDDDPVFSLIENHKKAHSRFLVAVNKLEVAERMKRGGIRAARTEWNAAFEAEELIANELSQIHGRTGVLSQVCS